MAFADPSEINASKGFPEFLDYVNTVTGDWFTNMLLISIYIIILVVYSRASNDIYGGLAVAGFGTFLVTFLMFLGQVASGQALAISIAFVLIGALALFWSRR